MIRKGPKIKLNRAPGRRTTSRTSLPMKAVVRVQLLSSPTNGSRITPTTVLPFVIGGVSVVTGDNGSKDLVKRGAVLSARDDFAAQRVDLLDDARHGCARLVGDYQELPRRILTYLTNARQVLELHRIERLRSFNLDHIPAERFAAELLWRVQGNQSPARQQRHAIAVLGFTDHLGRDHERAADLAQAPELRPDLLAQNRVEARGGLIHEQQQRVMHQRAGELQTTLHPARQLSSTPAAGVPQLDQLQHLVHSTAAFRPQQPKQGRDEGHVLGGRQLVVQDEVLRHIAELLADMTRELTRVLTQDGQLALGGLQRARQH